MNNIQINVFIENEYKDFSPKSFDKNDLEKMIQNLPQMAEKMTKFYISTKEWYKDSCLTEYDYKLLYFDVVLCDNEKIQEINKNYREKDCATDVITFAIFSDSPKEERFIFDNEINLGEIIISLDKTETQSLDKSHLQQSFKDELYFLLAHGILHLLGYDHKDEQTLKEMWDIQQKMIEGALQNV